MRLRFHIPDDGAPGTRRLLDALLEHAPEEGWLLGDILAHVRQRAYGVATLIATLPAFLPVPVGAGTVGLLIALFGLQMLAGRETPWLPAAIAGRRVPAERLRGFVAVADRWLDRLEKVCRPRWTFLTAGAGLRVCGVMLALMGVLLALPLPLTNYPFALVMLLYAVALIERDGRLIVLSWVLIAAIALSLALLGGQAFQLLLGWLSGS
ncbi:MAG: exopolysaccharide biosynthesis protein [Xanthomonadales bacterium]|nr:exopolysaccharide biosynthesis protein [Xanthomonadales bacterium]